MRRMLIIGTSSAALWFSALSGCSDMCEDLVEICARCVDEDYRQSCEATVRAGVQGVCSGRRGIFNAACPAEDLFGASSSSVGAGGAGGSSSAANTGGSSAGGSSAGGSSAGGASAGGASAGGASAGGSGGN